MKPLGLIRSSFATVVAAIAYHTFGVRDGETGVLPHVIYGQSALPEKEPIYIERPMLPRRGQRLHLVQKRREHAAELLRLAKVGNVPRMNRATRRADAKRLRLAT